MVRSVAGFLACLVLGGLSATAAVLVHHAWWGLALGLSAGVATLAWLPGGAPRVGFAVGWLLVVSRATLTLPAGDYLVASDTAGWSFLAGSFVLIVAAMATPGRRPGRADDHGVRGSAT